MSREDAIKRLLAPSEITHPFKTILHQTNKPPIQLVSNIVRADKRRGWKQFWSQGNRPRIAGQRRTKRMFWRGMWPRFRDPS